MMIENEKRRREIYIRNDAIKRFWKILEKYKALEIEVVQEEIDKMIISVGGNVFGEMKVYTDISEKRMEEVVQMIMKYCVGAYRLNEMDDIEIVIGGRLIKKYVNGELKEVIPIDGTYPTMVLRYNVSMLAVAEDEVWGIRTTGNLVRLDSEESREILRYIKDNVGVEI